MSSMSSMSSMSTRLLLGRAAPGFGLMGLGMLLVVIALGCGDNFSRARPADAGAGMPDAVIGMPDAIIEMPDAVIEMPDAVFGTDTTDADAADAGPGDADGPDGATDAPPPPWAHHGPGNPGRTFRDDQLFANCAFLDGGKGDTFDHHDVAVMFDGYLLLAWAPEWGMGGLTFYDISDPCAPVTVGSTEAVELRETHTIGFSNLDDGVWAVTSALVDNDTGGIGIWDVSDTRAPRWVARVDTPGFHYPDGYAGVVFWAFWQGRYIYLGAGDNGIVIVDALVPSAPVVAKQIMVEPFLRAHQVMAIGNLLFVNQAASPRAVVLDISDPLNPQPIPGGDFEVRDGAGNAMNKYSLNFNGGDLFFAKQVPNGGGVTIYDVRDPTRPTLLGEYTSAGGAGAYLFVQEPFIFAGDSNFGTLLDMTDPTALTSVGTFRLKGDLDFVTPIGNIAVLSVDDAADTDRASAIVPWRRDPDRRSPRVTFSVPGDGATGVPLTSRIGVTFSEFIDAMSAWRPGAVRLREEDGALVDVIVNAQDTILNVSPREDLKPSTRYTLEIPAGVIEDWSGNAVAVPFTLTFETAAP